MPNICSVDGCSKVVVTHGLCDMHRKRLVRHGHLAPTRAHDWGDREKHPMYKIWAQHRRYDYKHPLAERIHKDFWEFVREISERPSQDHHLRPINSDIPIDKDNYHWVESVTKHLKSADQKAYLREYSREDRRLNPDKYRGKSLQKQFGIGIVEYDAMYEKQNGLCGICGVGETALNPKTGKPRYLAVDHCHTDGRIRQLLCGQCNTGLGCFKEDMKLLAKAIAYLKKVDG